MKRYKSKFKEAVHNRIRIDDSSDIGYFKITHRGKGAIVEVSKESGGKWSETIVDGDDIYSIGGKEYQSYLKLSDIKSWLQRDFDRVEYLGTEYEPNEDYED